MMVLWVSFSVKIMSLIGKRTNRLAVCSTLGYFSSDLHYIQKRVLSGVNSQVMRLQYRLRGCPDSSRLLAV